MIKKLGLTIFWTVILSWMIIIFPTFLITLIPAIYLAIKSKQYLNYFKPNESFSSHVTYSNYMIYAGGFIILFHSFFAYFHYDYKFYPVRDPGDVWIDVLGGMIWISEISVLMVILGRNFGDDLRNKGVDFIFAKRTLPYAKRILLISPIHIAAWYALTLWRPELDNNTKDLPHTFFRFHTLWFLVYVTLYYSITFALVKLFNEQTLRKMLSPIISSVKRFPDISLFILSIVFLMQSKAGSIIGNPESINTIDPLTFLYFFVVFLIGIITADSKNYIISYTKLFLYISLAIFLLFFLYSTVTAQTPYIQTKFALIVLATSGLIVCQNNITISSCCLFFSKVNPIGTFLKPVFGPLFLFNMPVIVALQYLLKSVSIPIIYKIIIVNCLTWILFISSSYLIKIGISLITRNIRKKQYNC